MKRILPLSVLALWVSQPILAQQTVTFPSSNGVTVTADLYVSHTRNPYIILLHGDRASRGEFKDIAPRLTNLNYNCLAVDLRSGGESNFVVNQTAQSARERNLPTDMLASLADVQAAISYVSARTQAPIILLGSAYSASLALIEATTNFKVKAVVAFSPGEFFSNPNMVKELTSNIYVPILALSAASEYRGMMDLLSHVPPKHLSLFRPSRASGTHGAKALWSGSSGSEEYWMAISSFFGKLTFK